eukprot:2225746-Prymnesium_polylepis.1
MSLLARQSDGRRRDGSRGQSSLPTSHVAECRSRPTSNVIRVPARAVRGAVTQLDSRLVRQ